MAPLGGMIGRERKLQCARSVVELQHYFAARIEERRESPRDDLLNAPKSRTTECIDLLFYTRRSRFVGG